MPNMASEVNVLVFCNNVGKMEQWTKSLDHGVPVDIIYLDFKKAFDTVPHRRLLTKLKAYGIRG